MKKTNVTEVNSKCDSLYSNHEMCDCAFSGDFSILTLQDVEDLILCTPLIKYNSLHVTLVSSGCMDELLSLVVSELKKNMSLVCVQSYGLEISTIQVVTAKHLHKLLRVLNKINSNIKKNYTYSQLIY